MKVWMWTSPDPPDNFVMLIVEDDEGDLHGLTFGGWVASEKQVELEMPELAQRPTNDYSWKRIA